jgi:hypothetical protein
VNHHVMEMIHDVIEWVALGIELLAVAVIAGAVTIRAFGPERRKNHSPYCVTLEVSVHPSLNEVRALFCAAIEQSYSRPWVSNEV